MLSLSYEAFHALDNLRYRANISYAQMAEIIGVDDSQYRRITHRVADGELAGLHGHVDRSVRKGIALLTYGFNEELLPLKKGKAHAEVRIRRGVLDDLQQAFELVWPKAQLDNDPIGFLEARRNRTDQSIPTQQLLDYALQFSGWAH
ncbi:MAG: hypothetical protein GY752_01225 [bacterium]|nr:hypothetical protein [bacterium]